MEPVLPLINCTPTASALSLLRTSRERDTHSETNSHLRSSFTQAVLLLALMETINIQSSKKQTSNKNTPPKKTTQVSLPGLVQKPMSDVHENIKFWIKEENLP